MKIKLFACIAFLSLMSCSGGDDSAPVTPENPNTENPEAKELDKVIVNSYYLGELSGTYTSNYDNNKLISVITSGTTRHFYTYADNGLLSLHEIYNNDDLIEVEEYEYDDLGRLLSVAIKDEFEGELYMMALMDYEYNDDNTVTRTIYSSSADRVDTYFLNEENLVYKVIGNDDEINEATYDGNNILSWDNDTDNIQYTYSDVSVKGHFLNEYINLFGSYRANAILHWNLSFAVVSTDKYCTQEIKNNELVEYSYEFDGDGYPIKKIRLENGVLSEESIITYKN